MFQKDFQANVFYESYFYVCKYSILCTECKSISKHTCTKYINQMDIITRGSNFASNQYALTPDRKYVDFGTLVPI